MSKPRVGPINSQHNNFKWGNIFAGIYSLVWSLWDKHVSLFCRKVSDSETEVLIRLPPDFRGGHDGPVLAVVGVQSCLPLDLKESLKKIGMKLKEKTCFQNKTKFIAEDQFTKLMNITTK